MGNIRSGNFDLSKLEYLSEVPDMQNTVHYGDFLFNTRNTLELVGKGATWMYTDKSYAFNGNIAKFTFTDNINTIFFNYLYNTRMVSIQVHSRAVGTTSVAAIYPRDMKNISYFLPALKEQSRIALLLSKVEHLIYLYQRKLDLLNQSKQGMLQKLFTSSENKQPILRFNKFYGDWEQCKLDNVFNERKVKSSEGQLLSVSISNGVYPFNEKNRKNNSSSDKSNYKLVEINDIAYNSMRMWQGAEGYSNYKGIVSPAYTVITPKEQESSLFFSFMFKQPKMLYVFQTHSQGLTSDTWNLKYPSFKQIVVIKPEFEEQERISTILIKIDKLISLYQNKINTLTTFKKFLLQQMFI